MSHDCATFTLDRIEGDVAILEVEGNTIDVPASALPAGGDVLDFGCGSGWAAAHLRDAGFQVSAIDGSSGGSAPPPS